MNDDPTIDGTFEKIEFEKCEKCKHIYGYGIILGEDKPRLLYNQREVYSARHSESFVSFNQCPLCGEYLEELC